MDVPPDPRSQVHPGRTVEHLGREARDSAALVLIVLAVVLTVSFVGLALS